MTFLSRPGIYQRPVRPTRRSRGLVRRDIPVLIGFTTRGPSLEPVRIESLRQLSGIFGEAFPSSHLFDAVKGFFETGGRTTYIVRLAGMGATAARYQLTTAGVDWIFTARTRVADLANLRAGEVALQWQENLIRSYGRSIPDVGEWGNGISLNIIHDEVREQFAKTDGSDRTRLYPAEMSGLEAGSLLLVTQGEESLQVLIKQADPLRGEVVLDRELPVGFHPDQSIKLSVRSASLEVQLNGQRVEMYEGFSPSPAHKNFLATIVNAQSRYISLEVSAMVDPILPSSGNYALLGGKDELHSQATTDWLSALKAQAIIDEIALVACPDLVRQELMEKQVSDAALSKPEYCHLPVAQLQGNIVARIIDANSGEGIEGVIIQAAGEGISAESGVDGKFILEEVSLGLVELRLIKAGYLPANPLIQASTNQTSVTLFYNNLDDFLSIHMIARNEIPALERGEITTVQRAMCEPLHVGDFRIAVLDPLSPQATPEDLLNWVAGLGETARGFAAGPWIGLSDAENGALRLQPPSGHVCGAFAVGELAQGVHRAPGNMLLRHVKSVPLEVDNVLAAEFYRAALNQIVATAGQGIRLMGGRTLSGDPAWQHVSVRRLFDALERTLLSRLNWVVFEPSNLTTRQLLKFSIEQLLAGMWQRGMFSGATADAAYQVRCDEDLNPVVGRTRGELIVKIAVAPTVPYEFITFSLSAQAEAIEVTEKT